MSDAYLRGVDREQVLLLPERIEDYVGANSIVRVIDAFVDSMRTGDDQASLPFARTMTRDGGRKGYDPRTLAKLLVWGYLNRVRSTRDLEKACRENLGVIWLMRKLMPDHCSISRFRTANAKRIKRWLTDFNRICAGLDLFGAEEVAVDGAILKAANSKANNFTQERLNKRLERQETEIRLYLDALESSEQEPDTDHPGEIEDLAEKLGQLLTAQEEARSMLAEAKASPTGQLSLVDPDARLLKKKQGAPAVVGYNAQSVVDSKHHLIAAVEVTQSGNDQGLLTPMLKAAIEGMANDKAGKEPRPPGPVRALADSGYADYDDIAAAEEAGFEPYVAIPDKGSSGDEGLFALESFQYEEAGDVYRCPAGRELHRHSDTKTHGSTYQCYYNTAVCRDCALRGQCTKGKYRKIKRHPAQAAIDRVRQRIKLHTDVYPRRAATVEHPFGSMLFWSPGRNLLCCGLEKSNAEFTLSALAYNVKRAAKVVGIAKLLEAFRRFLRPWCGSRSGRRGARRFVGPRPPVQSRFSTRRQFFSLPARA